MICDNLSFINNVDDKSLSEFVINDCAIYYVCPNCKSTHVVRNGHYIRKIAHLDDSSSSVIIQKLLCKDCHTSFKELPKNVSSYNRYSIVSIIKILFSKESMRSLNKNYHIAINTIRRYLRKFKDVRNKIEILLRKLTVDSLDILLSSYKNEYDIFLLESSTNTDSSMVYIFKIT